MRSLLLAYLFAVVATSESNLASNSMRGGSSIFSNSKSFTTASSTSDKKFNRERRGSYDPSDLEILPPPDQYNMGVTGPGSKTNHYAKLQEYVNQNKIALFVRISDRTSLDLIDTDKFA